LKLSLAALLDKNKINFDGWQSKYVEFFGRPHFIQKMHVEKNTIIVAILPSLKVKRL
jgi:hypothetical protein